MMKKYLACGAIAVSLAVTGCAGGPREQSGAGIGAVGGGVLGGLVGSSMGGTGSTLLGVGIGALAGGLIGGAIGRDLDQQDRAYMDQRASYALSQGNPYERYEWRNPNNDHYGYITPYEPYQTSQGYCREFSTEVYVGGRHDEAYGVACRQRDGSWQIAQNAEPPPPRRGGYRDSPPPSRGGYYDAPPPPRGGYYDGPPPRRGY